MKRTLLTVLAILGTSALVMGAVANTPHDFSNQNTNGAVSNTTQICVFCHTPHQSDGVIQDPLWNHTLQPLSTTYAVYDSTTLDHSPGQIGNITPGDQAPSSFLCMSCHDGTVGVNSLYNDPNDIDADPTLTAGVTWDDTDGSIINTHPTYLGTDLSNDHPVNFTYNSTLDAENGLVTTASVPAQFLPGGEVQCSSCHDPHDNSVDTANGAFLRHTMQGSALCTQCHLK